MYECHYCGVSLDTPLDYSCVLCGHQTCDNCSQACQAEEDCDTITCNNCVELHLANSHTKESHTRLPG